MMVDDSGLSERWLGMRVSGDFMIIRNHRYYFVFTKSVRNFVRRCAFFLGVGECVFV